MLLELANRWNVKNPPQHCCVYETIYMHATEGLINEKNQNERSKGKNEKLPISTGVRCWGRRETMPSTICCTAVICGNCYICGTFIPGWPLLDHTFEKKRVARVLPLNLQKVPCNTQSSAQLSLHLQLYWEASPQLILVDWDQNFDNSKTCPSEGELLIVWDTVLTSQDLDLYTKVKNIPEIDQRKLIVHKHNPSSREK